MIKVSVIIPAYNIEKYIEKCIKSILNQTLNSIEIIVINDGSTDNTLKKIKKFSDNNSIKIIDKKNEGVVRVRECGLENSIGKYILFVDGDDWLEKNCIEELYNNAEANKSDVVLYNSYWSCEKGKRPVDTFNLKDNILEDPLRELFLGNIMPAIWAKFIKREFLITNEIQLPYGLAIAEDLAYVADVFMCRPKVNCISSNLYNYYSRSDSVTKTVDKRILDVDKALSLIQRKLKMKNMYNSYKYEFEKLAFQQLFIYRIYNSPKLEKVNRVLYNLYKSRGIKIKRNNYILEDISKYNVGAKIRINIYVTNYNLGKIYDLCRNTIKHFLIS